MNEEMFKQLLENKYDSEFEMVTKYINAFSPIKLNHKKCGKELEVVPDLFNMKYECPICKFTKKTSFNTYIENLKEKYNILSDPKDFETEITVSHKLCGEEIKINPLVFDYKKPCSTCINKKKTLNREQEFVDYLENTFKGEFELVGNYTNSKTTVKLKHTNCGKQFEVKPSNFKKSPVCHVCTKCNIKINTEDFKKEVFDAEGDNYTVLGTYLNNHTKIEIKHNVCGNEYSVTRLKFNLGRRCPYCAGKKITAESFQKETEKIVGKKFKFIVGYTTALAKMELEHIACGNRFEITPRKFKKTYCCPVCEKPSKSKNKEINTLIKEYFGADFELHSDYINQDTKFEVLHRSCGSVSEHYYRTLISDKSCNCGQPFIKGTQNVDDEFTKFKTILDICGKSEYKLMSDYENNAVEVSLYHETCGEEFNITPKKFKSGSRCPHCKQIKKQEDYKRKLENSVGNKYEIITPYKSSTEKMKFRHRDCGKTFEHYPNFYRNLQHCPACSKISNKKITTSEYKEIVKNLVGEEYEVLGEYENNNSKIEMYHTSCKSKFSTRPKDFKNGSRCSVCANNQLKTQEEYLEEFNEFMGEEYELLSEYRNAETKVEVLHKVCQQKYTVYTYNIKKGSKCPHCAKSKKKTTEQFSVEIDELTNGEFKVISEYVNKDTKIKLAHKDCHSEFDILPSSFLRSRNCPKCTSSKGENAVRNALNNLKVKFKEQVTIRPKNTCLFVDFVVYQGNKPTYFIEFDGEQHYSKPTKLFGGLDGFAKLQHNDKLKNYYAKLKHINMIRIPYHQINNVDEILNNLIVTK